MTIYVNSGLKMYLQSAIAAAKTIASATNASPGVFTSTAHGYADGDVILLETEGMTEVNNQVFVVLSKTNDTFQLAGPDGLTGISTAAYGVLSSGTAKKITLGTSISGVQEFSPNGGDIKFVNSTTVHDTTDKQIVSGANPLSYNLTMQWDPSNTGQQAMQTAFESGAQRVAKIQWPSGVFVLFYGSVGFNNAPGGSSQGITTVNAALALAGNVRATK